MKRSVTKSVLGDDLRSILEKDLQNLDVAVVGDEVDRLRERVRELASAVLLLLVLVALEDVFKYLGVAAFGRQLNWPHLLVITDFALDVEVGSEV